MATVGNSNLTLVDLAKRQDPTGKIDRIVEMLMQTNELLFDMVIKEGNLPTGHRVTIRAGLPTVYWRLLNEGTVPSKSTTAQVDETCGMMEAWGVCDEELAKLSGDIPALRLSEATAFIEAMNQEMVSTLIYGNSSVAKQEFTGFALRYSSLSATNAQNIIDGGGTGSDNMSIWLVIWGDESVYGITPKGSPSGIQHEDLGVETVEVTGGIAGSMMRAYRDVWRWKLGLVVKNWQYVVRICNIDVSNLVAESSAADIMKLMTKATWRPPTLNVGRAAFYMNRTCGEMLDIQAQASVKAGGQLGYKDVDGKRILTFRGIPIRTTDQLLETEARVV
jgi:hypothetical protein